MSECIEKVAAAHEKVHRWIRPKQHLKRPNKLFDGNCGVLKVFWIFHVREPHLEQHALKADRNDISFRAVLQHLGQGCAPQRMNGAYINHFTSISQL